MKNWMVWGSLVLSTASLSACNNDDVETDTVVESDFQENENGWTGHYALYEDAHQDSISFLSGRRRLVSPLDTTRYGFKVEGKNVEDSLFLYVKKKLSGLNPSKTYFVYYSVDLSSGYPDTINSAGRLGSLKVGASANEPLIVKSGGASYNGVAINKGLWNVDGKEMVVLGNLSNTATTPGYKLIGYNNNTKPVAVTPNTQGEIWLCVGADTRFKGITSVLFDRIKVTVR
jgi:hypothetical protein